MGLFIRFIMEVIKAAIRRANKVLDILPLRR